MDLTTALSKINAQKIAIAEQNYLCDVANIMYQIEHYSEMLQDAKRRLLELKCEVPVTTDPTKQ
jgi:hypothetical protein